MPTAPEQYRPAGWKQTDRTTRTAEQIEYRRWYRRLPWTDGKAGGLRGQQLQRNPCCEECERMGITTAASHVDHRIPHRGNWDLFIDETNHVSLCHPCHSKKTAKGQ